MADAKRTRKEPPSAATLLAGIREGETCTAYALGRRHGVSTATVIALLDELIAQGKLEAGPCGVRSMRVYRPRSVVPPPVIRRIDGPDSSRFRETLSGYDAEMARLTALRMLVRRQ